MARPRLDRSLLVAAFALFLPAVSAGQSASPVAVSLALGPSPYDLSGTGTGFAAAAQLPWEPVVGIVVEPGVTFFTYSSQFDTRFSYLFPELSLQAQLREGRCAPSLASARGERSWYRGPAKP